MTNRRAPSDRVKWSQGMLLAPQHFQQWELRFEELVHYRTSLARPHQWGVVRLDIDLDALGDGRLTIEHLEVVMRDGLVVGMSSTGGGPAFEAALRLPAPDERLRLHLAVARARSSAEEIGAAQLVDTKAEGNGSGSQPSELPRPSRFGSRLDPEVHEYDTADSGEAGLTSSRVNISRLQVNAHLVLGDVSGDFESLPLLELVQHGDTGWKATDFTPPTIVFNPDDPVGRMARGILAKLRDKARPLVKRITVSELSGSDFAGQTRMTLSGLVRALPRLQALLRADGTSPFDVYLALCDVAGAVAPWGAVSELVPTLVGGYTHDDLRGCFGLLTASIDRSLDAIQESFVSVAFIRSASGFTHEFEEEYEGRTFVVGVSGRLGEDLSEWMDGARIGRLEDLSEADFLRTRGWRRSPLPLSENVRYGAPTSVQLYRVEHDADGIEAATTVVVAASVEGATEPEEVRIYLRNPRLAEDLGRSSNEVHGDNAPAQE